MPQKGPTTVTPVVQSNGSVVETTTMVTTYSAMEYQMKLAQLQNQIANQTAQSAAINSTIAMMTPIVQQAVAAMAPAQTASPAPTANPAPVPTPTPSPT